MKYVYSFNEGNKNLKNLLGGKGASLAEMTNLGLPIPKGFTITTEACKSYYDNNSSLLKEIIDEILKKVEELEKNTNKIFGNKKNPLLLSIRSGARISMPGMMDTILNLGMNDEISQSFENKRFSYDSYRRFIQMYADVVMNFPKSSFEGLLDKYKEEKQIKNDSDLSEKDLFEIIKLYKIEYKKYSGVDFPQDPKEQLITAVSAVFRSWNNARAVTYRRLNDIPSSWGTAVNVQEMVFGNKNNDSATGVAFTRNPATGENKLFGEYLINAQGEDVVAGIRTPKPIEKLKEEQKECFEEFLGLAKKLENYYHDMQDMEFTIEDKKLYILQTRSGKRTGSAAIKIAMDLLKENVISEKDAILMVDAKTLEQVLHPNFDHNKLKDATLIGKGLAASTGAAFGKIYFTAKDIEKHVIENENLILVREDTSPEDITGINLAKGILTLRGGMTSHAAVVARGMGSVCVVGCSDLKIDEENKALISKEGTILKEGDYVSLDGSTGYVYKGKIDLINFSLSDDFKEFLEIADKYRTLKIRANAETKEEAIIAKNFGAEGIGLCRTEHMFFEKTRIHNFRKMILAKTKFEINEALENILPYQIDDFYNLFKEMNGFSLNIRLLDPPLHEFLPKTQEEKQALALSLGKKLSEIDERINELKEFNPMMGHRGIRLGITYPEIIKMQVTAIIKAAIKAKQEKIEVCPEIMIPLVCDKKELEYVKKIIKQEIDSLLEKENVFINYKIGTMIELPRAAILSSKIASLVDFYSFGTNDLTQMTYGFSRDDAGKFLSDYYEKQIFEFDPFVRLDVDGVGQLIKYAKEAGKKNNTKLEVGVCGEHSGDPKSIEFFNSINVDYISCSCYRIPISRLAASQAAIKSKG